METNGKMTSEKSDPLITVLFCTLLLYITYAYAYTMLSRGGLNDYASHVTSLLPLFRSGSWWEGWMAAPHCLWHVTILFFYGIFQIPMEAAASYATCVYVLFYYLLLLWVIRKVTAYVGKRESLLRANLLAFGLNFIQALYFFWLDGGDRYLGTFSMNPLHNPTQMCVRGFGLICFCLVIDIIGVWSKEDYVPIFFPVKKGEKKYFVLLSGMLFLSTVMKPTFTEIFVPAVAFFMLKEWIVRLIKKMQPGEYFKKCLCMLLCATPALIYMLIQYAVFFAFGGSYGNEGGLVITGWLEVWNLFTENVALSVLLGMAFPLYMILIDGNFFFKSAMGQISLLGYGIGFLEAALLGEEGSRMSHANFIWPMMSGMLLLWVTAFLRLLVLERTQDKSKLQRALITFGWILFCGHVLCGFLFLQVEFAGL